LKLAERVGELEPDLILLSYVPPVGLTPARYLMKRLRAHLAQVPLCVGYWDASADPAQAVEPLRKVGVYRVARTVVAARDLILGRDAEIGEDGPPAPEDTPEAEPYAKTPAEAAASAVAVGSELESRIQHPGTGPHPLGFLNLDV
jgi:hypothetical protein